MNTQLANAIIATSFNINFGGLPNKAMTPASANKMTKGNKLGLLRTLIEKNNSDLYTVEQAEQAFALIVELN